MKKITNKIILILFITLALFNQNETRAQSCDDENTGTISTGNYYIPAGGNPCVGTLTSNSAGVSYTSTAVVDYVSASEIQLNPGFHAGGFSTGIFHAYIDNLTILTQANANGSYAQLEKMEFGIILPEVDITRNDYTVNANGDWIPTEPEKVSVNLKDDIDAFFNSNTYPNKFTNPYDFEDIEIEITFTHISTGETFKTWGFYYKDYEYEFLGASSDPSVTNLPEDWVELSKGWRARFAPPEIGDYSTKIKISCYDQVVYENNDEKTFTVESSDNLGYLKFNSGSKYMSFSKAGETFIPVGYGNMDAAALDGNVYTNSAGEYYLNSLFLDNIKGRGNYLRIGQYNNFFIEQDYPLNYDSHQNTMWEFDNFLKKAEDNNIYLNYILNFFQSFFMCGENTQNNFDNDGNNGSRDYLGSHPYRKAVQLGDANLVNEGTLMPTEDISTSTSILNFFGEEGSDVRILYKNRLKYILARWGYSTNIALFDMWAELENTTFNHKSFSDPDNPCGRLDTRNNDINNKLINWVPEMSLYFKTLDVSKHLLSLNHISGYLNPDYLSNPANNISKIPTIDVEGFDFYSCKRNGLFKLYDGVQLTRSFLSSNGLNKPIDLPEVGIGDDPAQKHIGMYNSVEFHNQLWASAFMGTVGPGLYFYRFYLSDIGLKKAENAYINNSSSIYGTIYTNFETEFQAAPNFWPNWYEITDANTCIRINEDGNPVINADYPIEDITPDFTNHLTTLTEFLNKTLPDNNINLQEQYIPQCYPTNYNSSNWGNYTLADVLGAFTLVESTKNYAIGWVYNRSNYWANYDYYSAYDDYGNLDLTNFELTDNSYHYSVDLDEDNCTSSQTFCTEDDSTPIPIDYVKDPLDMPYFTITGLSNATYNIKWYNTLGYFTNATNTSVTEVTNTDCQQSTSVPTVDGILTLTPPCLASGYAYDYAFIIEKQQLKGLLENGEITHEKFGSIIEVIPNPNSGLFNLYLIEGFEGDIEVTIINSIGSVVFQKNVHNTKNISLNIENEPNGIYFIKVKSNTSIKVEKIIKN